MIKYTISNDEFWTLAQERGWMTKADAIKGIKLSKYIDTIIDKELTTMDEVIKMLTDLVIKYSNNIEKDEVTSALLTIVRLYN